MQIKPKELVNELVSSFLFVISDKPLAVNFKAHSIDQKMLSLNL